MFARVHAASFRTEVSAAAKRAMFVDGAAAIPAQKRAGSVGVRLQLLPAAGPHPLGSVKRLSPREHGGVSGQTEMAAAGAHLALPGQRAALQLGIDGLYFLTKFRGGLAVFHAVHVQHGFNEGYGMRFLQSGIWI